MSQKILITGGAGFIGSNFVYYTRATHPQDEIVVVDKLTYAGNLDNIAPLLQADGVRFIQGDVADRNFVDSLFSEENFTMVVNFAAETHVDRSIKEPAIFVETNVMGTLNLLEATRDYNVARYHQISTDEVYGDLGDGSTNFFTEETPIAPNCPYAASKASADLLVYSYFETYKMFLTISRCSNNYGPFQYPEKLIPFFFQLAKNDKPLPLYGDGKNVRDWLYVTDHCEAIDLILRKGKPGDIYNIGGHNEKQNIEIAQLILEFLGKPKTFLTYIEDRLAHDRRYAMDPSRIGRELGWKPRTTFEDGIQKTFKWYEDNQDWCNSLHSKNAPELPPARRLIAKSQSSHFIPKKI